MSPGFGTSPEDRRASEFLITGGVWMALQVMPAVTRADLITVDGVPTNELVVELEFMDSPYRVTVTAAPELARDASAGR